MKSTSIKSPNSPHFWWIISTLGLTIIALVAFVLTNRIACANKIMDYISYASVILSITLSVFALLYTYTSNVQIQQQFEKINSAADNNYICFRTTKNNDWEIRRKFRYNSSTLRKYRYKTARN